MSAIQYVHIKRGRRIAHIETELGIVNIHVGLKDRFGRKVVNVQILPDQHVGELPVILTGNRLIQLKRKRRADPNV